MKQFEQRRGSRIIVGLAVAMLGVSGILSLSWAADDVPAQGSASQSAQAKPGDVACCQPGDKTPPTELVAKIPKGQLKSPYPDVSKVAQEGHHQFSRPGCNECHGGTGGGGICPPLTQGIWFWGDSDDTLFRLVTLGTQGLQKLGYQRLAQSAVEGPMPPMGAAIETSDNLWKIIAWIRTINPPPSKPVAQPDPN